MNKVIGILLTGIFLGGFNVFGCSCGYAGNPFLIESGTLIPKNYYGLPWAGKVKEENGDRIWPVEESFVLLDISGKNPKEIPIQIIESSFPFNYDIPYSQDILLIRPKKDFQVGKKYRISYRPRDKKTPLEKGSSGVEITVSDETIDLGLGFESIIIENQETGKLSVTTFAGSCGTGVVAAKRKVKFNMPEVMKIFQNSFLYFTFVDGEFWQPSSNLCRYIPLGRSWVEIGGEILFSACEIYEFAPPAYSISEGDHEIQMVAWLPGTEQVFTAKNSINLNCG